MARPLEAFSAHPGCDDPLPVLVEGERVEVETWRSERPDYFFAAPAFLQVSSTMGLH